MIKNKNLSEPKWSQSDLQSDLQWLPKAPQWTPKGDNWNPMAPQRRPNGTPEGNKWSLNGRPKAPKAA